LRTLARGGCIVCRNKVCLNTARQTKISAGQGNFDVKCTVRRICQCFATNVHRQRKITNLADVDKSHTAQQCLYSRSSWRQLNSTQLSSTSHPHTSGVVANAGKFRLLVINILSPFPAINTTAYYQRCVITCETADCPRGVPRGNKNVGCGT